MFFFQFIAGQFISMKLMSKSDFVGILSLVPFRIRTTTHNFLLLLPPFSLLVYSFDCRLENARITLPILLPPQGPSAKRAANLARGGGDLDSASPSGGVAGMSKSPSKLTAAAKDEAFPFPAGLEPIFSEMKNVLSARDEDVRSSYKPGPLLGKGAYGVVLGCVHLKTGKRCDPVRRCNSCPLGLSLAHIREKLAAPGNGSAFSY